MLCTPRAYCRLCVKAFEVASVVAKAVLCRCDTTVTDGLTNSLCEYDAEMGRKKKESLTKVVGGSEASDLHILLVVGPAL